MKQKLYMYWYRMPEGKNNFGDVLGPYLVQKLSGLRAIFVPIISNKSIKGMLILFYTVFIGQNKLTDLISLVRSLKYKNTLLSIGSIIGWYDDLNYNVWGSGIMHENEDIKNANFYAVRGKYTQNRIKELGYNVPDTIGDPGLLLPLVYNPRIKNKFKLGIIPHYVHYSDTCKLIERNDVLIINLLDDIEKVVRDIKSCEYTISSSLHGIIESHAYGIPSIWCNLPGGKLAGDNIKYLDYFSSVDIDIYKPYELNDLKNINLDQIIENINDNCDINSINKKIRDLQIGLLKAAPFKLLDRYLIMTI